MSESSQGVSRRGHKEEYQSHLSRSMFRFDCPDVSVIHVSLQLNIDGVTLNESVPLRPIGSPRTCLIPDRAVVMSAVYRPQSDISVHLFQLEHGFVIKPPARLFTAFYRPAKIGWLRI